MKLSLEFEVPGSNPASSAATTRVRSTTRARRLLVPSARTEQALVRIAGATTEVSTPNGLLPAAVYCIRFLSFRLQVWRLAIPHSHMIFPALSMGQNCCEKWTRLARRRSIKRLLARNPSRHYRKLGLASG